MRNRNTSALCFTCSSGAYMQDSGGQAGCSGSRGKAPISLSQEWVWSQPRPDPKSDPSSPAALSNTDTCKNGGNVHRCKKKSCKFCIKFCTKRKAQVFLNEHQLRWAQQNRFSVAGKTLCSCFWFKPQNSSDRRSERGNSYAADKFPLDLPCRHTVLRCSACH